MSTGPSPNRTSLSASKVTELKALCSKYGLTVSGNKSDLVNRLLVYFETIQPSSPQAPVNKELTQSTNSTTTIQSTLSKPTDFNKTAPAQINQPSQTVQTTTSSHKINSNPTNESVEPVTKTSSSNSITNEMEKLKQRAERFGLEKHNGNTNTIPNEEEIKKLTRAKRFGISNDVNGALDRPLADGKKSSIKSVTDSEWEARKRKRAEKFGLIDNPPLSNHKDNSFHRKNRKFNDYRPIY